MKNVVITILSILVLGLGCFIVYDKVINKGEKKEDNAVEEKIGSEEDYDLVEAKKLIDKYVYADFDLFDDFSNRTVESKVVFAILNVRTGDINNEYIGNLESFDCSNSAEIGTDYECSVKNSNNTAFKHTSSVAETISYDTLNASYKELYGNDQDISKIQYISMGFGPAYQYVEEINSYVKVHCGACGGISVVEKLYGVKSAKLDGNKLVINVGMIQVSPSGDDYNKVVGTINGQDVKFTYDEIHDSMGKTKKEFLSKYLDKLDTYEFDFIKEDGIYKLRDVKKVD